MIIRIVGANDQKTGKQIKFLKEYFTKRGKKVSVSKFWKRGQAKNFLKLTANLSQHSKMCVLQGIHLEQQGKAIKQLKKGEIVITDKWSEFCLVYRSRFPLKERIAFGNIEETLFENSSPKISFLLEFSTHKNCQKDPITKISGKHWQKTLLDLARRKTEKGWFVLNGEVTDREIHEQIVEYLSLLPELRNLLLTHKDA
ncbi:hypothetical protein KAR26_00475 [Candidatus Parcubacteria bacterium]|nr:hypothetical protein [Candidatus Parcubacteria bacterium]